MFQLESLLQVASLAVLGSRSKTTDILSVVEAIRDTKKLRENIISHPMFGDKHFEIVGRLDEALTRLRDLETTLVSSK